MVFACCEKYTTCCENRSDEGRPHVQNHADKNTRYVNETQQLLDLKT